MDREIVLSHQTVVIEDGRIVALGPAQSIKIPGGSQRIDGTNRYLMPRLVDMHVHFIRPAIQGKPQKSSAATYAKENEQLALLFLANGVTTVRNMWGHPEILKFNDHILRGDILGPTIYSVGPITDGDPPVNAGSRVVTTEQEAQEAVREDKERGYIAIKVDNNLSVSAYRAIVAAAAKEHLSVVGHVPKAVGLTGALESHQASIEHFSSFPRAVSPDGVPQSTLSLNDALSHADLSKLPAMAEALKAVGSWTCPTVVQVQWDAARDPRFRYMTMPQRACESSEAGTVGARQASTAHLSSSDTGKHYLIPSGDRHGEACSLADRLCLSDKARATAWPGLSAPAP